MQHRTRLLPLRIVSVLTLAAILAALTPAFLAAHSVVYAQETLAAPALTAEATDATTVELGWEAVDGAARYELWAWDRVNLWYRLGGDSLTGTAYTHGNLTTGTAYYYQIRALGAGGAEGPWSQRVSATPRAPADVTLAAPELTADPTGATTIELGWGAVVGAVRYELWAWDPVNDWYRLGGDSLTATAYTHRNLTAGTTYYYQIRALGADGAEGPWSQRVSATVPAASGTPLTTPTPTSTATLTATLTLTPTSTAPPTAATPTLTPTPTPTSTAPPTTTTPTPTPTATPTSTAPPTAATPTPTPTATPTSTATPTATTPASAPTPTPTPTPAALTLAAPALTAVAADATTVELGWEAVDGAASYELWAWDRVNRWYRLGGDSLTGTTYTHGGLTTGTTYYYQVRALDVAGAEGPWSQRVSATPRAPSDVTLAAPELTADPTGATTIELAWGEVTGAARYELWAWDPVNDWYRLGGDTLTATAYTHRDLTPGTTYYYQMRALGAGGAEGPWSQRVSATVPAASGTPLPTPTPTSTATLTATPTPTPTLTPTLTPTATSTPPPLLPPLSPPPASLNLDPYYRKYLDAGGIPIVAPSDVDDAELYHARGTIDGMLANRPDIRATMAANRFRVVIFKNDGCLGPFQIPELRDERPPGRCTSVIGAATIRWLHHPHTRELLLIIDAVGAAPGALPYCNDVFVHEFAHLVHYAIAIDAAFDSGRPLFDSRFDQRLRGLYNAALAAGLYVDAYAATNYREYWAEAVTFSFLPHALTYGVRTPPAVSELADYDPAIARQVEDVFGSATVPDCIPAYFRVRGTVTGPAAEPLAGVIVVAQKIACASSAGRCFAVVPPQQALATGRDGAYVVALRKALSATVQRLLRQATGERDFDSSFVLGVARRGWNATGECPAGYLAGAGGRVENVSRRNAALLEIPDGDLSGISLTIAPNFDWTPFC